jgi:hypothetical protein
MSAWLNAIGTLLPAASLVAATVIVAVMSWRHRRSGRDLP